MTSIILGIGSVAMIGISLAGLNAISSDKRLLSAFDQVAYPIVLLVTLIVGIVLLIMVLTTPADQLTLQES